jgi:hypothetical protein
MNTIEQLGERLTATSSKAANLFPHMMAVPITVAINVMKDAYMAGVVEREVELGKLVKAIDAYMDVTAALLDNDFPNEGDKQYAWENYEHLRADIFTIFATGFPSKVEPTPTN